MSTDQLGITEISGINLDFYKSIIESSPSGYTYNKIILDGNGALCDYEFIEVNIAFENLTGLKRSNIIGRKFTEVFSGMDNGAFEWIRLCGEVALNGGEKEIVEFSNEHNRWYKVIVFSRKKNYFVTHFIDITKEKEHLSELQKSEDYISSILDSMNVGTWTWNVQTGEAAFNERWAQILGYTLEEISPVSIKTWTNHLFPEDSEISAAALKRVFGRELDYYDVECRMKHKNGSLIWVQDRGKVTSWTDDGKPLMMSGTHTDITARKNMEIRLQESEEKFRNIFLAEMDAIFLVDQETGSLLEANDSACKVYGYAHDEIIRLKNIDLSAEPNETMSATKEFMASIPLRYHKRKDGSVFPVEIKSSLFTLKNRKVILADIRDISEKKAIEDNLKKSEEQMREVLENSLDASYKRNLLTGTYDYLSPVFRQLSGYTINEMNSFSEESLIHLMHPDDLPEIGRVLAASTTGDIGMAYNLEYRFRHKEGHYCWFHDKFVVMRDEYGQNEARIGSVRDITEKKKYGLEMIRAKNEAVEANAAKSNFLSNMSHEIRTPMNGFIGVIQLMEMSELTAEQRELLRIAKSSANSLLVLINDILDYSKIEAGKMQMEKTIFSLGNVINDTILLFKPSAMKTGLLLETSIEKEVPDNQIGDPFRLRQIISNLLGNAVKFTKAGRIELSVRKIEDTNDKEVKLEFAVKDTGIGISPEKTGILFKRFSQVDGSNTHGYGGAGLGLSICKGLVEKMGGEIWVESVEGIGSSFYFTCVFEKAVKKTDSLRPAVVIHTVAQREISILLVEDDSVSRRVVELFARRKGWKVAIADNGKAAIDILKQKSFDVVLMDLQMPIMNGYAATAIIRESEAANGMHMPIIAMTALAIEGDRKKCLEAGMDDYMTKPVDVNLFYAMVEKWSGNNDDCSNFLKRE